MGPWWPSKCFGGHAFCCCHACWKACCSDSPSSCPNCVFWFHQPIETLGDGMAWEEMDHVMRLRFLTPRVIETGRPDRPDTGFFDCLPQAVKDPVSAKRKAQMEKQGPSTRLKLSSRRKNKQMSGTENYKRSRRNTKMTKMILLIITPVQMMV